MTHEEGMRLALIEAHQAAMEDEVPVGAVVVCGGAVLARAHNRTVALSDGTAHAELLAMQAAARRRGGRLSGCTLYVTLEPCAMCAGAAVLARVARIVFGAWDPKAGACGSVWDLPRDRRALHRPEVVGGVLETECAAALVDFFGPHRGG